MLCQVWNAFSVFAQSVGFLPAVLNSVRDMLLRGGHSSNTLGQGKALYILTLKYFFTNMLRVVAMLQALLRSINHLDQIKVLDWI